MIGRKRNPLAFLLKKSHRFMAGLSDHPSTADSLFGQPLEKAVATTGATTPYGCVPELIHRCVNEMMRRGLHTEGIFRLSASPLDIQWLQSVMDRPPLYGQDVNLQWIDLHVIAGLVKKYLRELPTPVIPQRVEESFFFAMQLSLSHRVLLLARLVKDLPPAHFDLVHYLVALSAAVQDHADENLMNPEALATVLAPICTGLEQTLKALPKKHCMDDYLECMQHNRRWIHIWTFMIEHAAALLAYWKTTSPQTHSSATVRVRPTPLVASPTHHRMGISRGQSFHDAHHHHHHHLTPALPSPPPTPTSPRYDVVVMRKRPAGYRNGKKAITPPPPTATAKDDLDGFLDTRPHPTSPSCYYYGTSHTHNHHHKRAQRRPVSMFVMQSSHSPVGVSV